MLQKAGIRYASHVLRSPENGDLAADEHALGSIAMANDREADICNGVAIIFIIYIMGKLPVKQTVIFTKNIRRTRRQHPERSAVGGRIDRCSHTI